MKESKKFVKPDEYSKKFVNASKKKFYFESAKNTIVKTKTRLKVLES